MEAPPHKGSAANPLLLDPITFRGIAEFVPRLVRAALAAHIFHGHVYMCYRVVISPGAYMANWKEMTSLNNEGWALQAVMCHNWLVNTSQD